MPEQMQGDVHQIPSKLWIVLGFSAALLALIFSAPPIRPISAVRCYSDPNCSPQRSSQPTQVSNAFVEDRRAILIEEVKKANEEIKMRIDQEDRWYDYKFLVVGALLATFLGQFARAGPQPDDQVLHLFHSGASCLALALACVLTVAIDIHIRDSMTVTNQLGNWLAYYAEPELLHSTFQRTAGVQFLAWENFLRIEQGMHNSILYSVTYWPHLHFLTLVVFITYLAVFHWLYPYQTRPLSQLILAGFFLVHLALGAFAWISHTAPETFEFTPFPFSGLAVSGWKAPLIYFALVVVLLLVNLLYSNRLRLRLRS